MEGAKEGTGNIYEKAGHILKQVEKGKGKTLNVCLKTKMLRKDKALLKCVYGIVQETLKHSKTISEVLDKTKIHAQEETDIDVLRTALSDFLYKKRLRCAGPLKEKITLHKEELRKAFREASSSDQTVSSLPTYLRVNTLRTTRKEAIARLQESGYCFIDTGDETGQAAQKNRNKKTFYIDKDIPNLLVFPSRVDLSENELYKTGHLVFQQKSSCFPALALGVSGKATVIDACAAPGNKTSHIAAMMENKGRIFAVEKDKNRAKLLKKMMAVAGVQNTVVCETDFLSLSPSEQPYKDAKYILLDPSCSGSGMKGGLLLKKKQTQISNMAATQKKLLLHALSFPSAEKIVYSTCSVNEEENEEVVRAVLRERKDFALARALPLWHRRGLKKYSFADLVCRADSDEDRTTGFFVAVFEKRNR
ncbi:MAG: rRNA m(5)C methyltransferase RCM1 [Amphiamblys sp. WSBS2006]|nr:MAG: rRNA m(5)C methyltransferase RCM1 [Amphiamblys sp. WSBS2006]